MRGISVFRQLESWRTPPNLEILTGVTGMDIAPVKHPEGPV
jgi:hypothetical protein